MIRNAICLFIFSSFVLWIFLGPYAQMQDLKKKNFDYAEKIKSLEQERVDMLEEQRRLEEDPDYLEKVARENMGLIRKGEVIYKFVPEENSE